MQLQLNMLTTFSRGLLHQYLSLHPHWHHGVKFDFLPYYQNPSRRYFLKETNSGPYFLQGALLVLLASVFYVSNPLTCGTRINQMINQKQNVSETTETLKAIP